MRNSPKSAAAITLGDGDGISKHTGANTGFDTWTIQADGAGKTVERGIAAHRNLKGISH